MRTKKTLGLLSAALMVSLGLAALPATSASAGTSDCDGTGVVGYFKRVGSGASFTHNGRAVDLMNESAIDNYNRGQITSGRKSGDSVWVDRTFKTFSSGIYTDAYIQSVVGYGGWKQCGPFNSMTQSVYTKGYASRVCAYIEGTTVCGKWYVD
ncbi:MAG: hypothetical protein QG608_2163 [Actinomycetota bacterium]|nr:hypothetical protein [Actinomycetota bacterium]